MGEEITTRNKLVSILGKRLGKNSFEMPSIDYWQPTGCLPLDLAIRDYKQPCGLPAGKVTEVYGKPGASKTAFLCRIIAECQQAGGFGVYVNTAEQGFNPEWGHACGVSFDDSCWLLANAFSLESAFQSVEDVVGEYHDSERPFVIVVDSVSGSTIVDNTMDERAVKDNAPAASGAKFLHEWFRRGVLYYLGQSRITVVVTRHLTESPRPFAGETTTHGSALNFYSWLRLKLTSKRMEDATTGVHTGYWVTAKITRSKVGPIDTEVSMPLYRGRGWDPGLEIVWWLQQNGALDAAKAEGGGARGKKGSVGWLWDGAALTTPELVRLYYDNAGVRAAMRDLVENHRAYTTAEKKQRGKSR